MAHLDVFQNDNPATKKSIPLLLDIQSDLLSQLDTRVVVPLYLQTAGKPASMTRLTPTVEIGSKKYIIMTPQLAGVPAKILKKKVASLPALHTLLDSALDLLVTGY